MRINTTQLSFMKDYEYLETLMGNIIMVSFNIPNVLNFDHSFKITMV